MRDADFYKAATVDGNNDHPTEPTAPPIQDPLEVAKQRAKNYQDDKKLYLVRGPDLFVIDSADIQVGAPVNGERTIMIKKAKMTKYAGDGRVVSD